MSSFFFIHGENTILDNQGEKTLKEQNGFLTKSVTEMIAH